MLIYGRGTKVLAETELSSEICPNCGKSGLSMKLEQQYVHVFWVPVFPYKKSARLLCPSCQHIYQEKEITGLLRLTVEQEKASHRAPVHLYSGLILAVLLIVGGSYSARQRDQHTAEYVAAPVVGDCYVMDTGEDDPSLENKYMILQVEEVTEDSLLFRVGSYGYTTPSAAEGHLDKGAVDETDYFTGEISAARSVIKSMYQDKKVTRIIRRGK